MTIVRYGAGEVGAGGQALPFARAVQADGWLHVSGQVAMHNGEIVAGGIIAQSHKAIQNLQSSMMVDCKVEVDCVAYRSDAARQ